MSVKSERTTLAYMTQYGKYAQDLSNKIGALNHPLDQEITAKKADQLSSIMNQLRTSSATLAELHQNYFQLTRNLKTEQPPKKESPAPEQKKATEAETIKKICGGCKNLTTSTMKCSKCKVYYCNSACQTRDWKAHKLICRAPT